MTKLLAELYSPFVLFWRFFNESSTLEKWIIAASIATILFILTLIACGSAFLLAVNGYSGYGA